MIRSPSASAPLCRSLPHCFWRRFCSRGIPDVPRWGEAGNYCSNRDELRGNHAFHVSSTQLAVYLFLDDQNAVDAHAGRGQKLDMRFLIILIYVAAAGVTVAADEVWHFKSDMLPVLVEDVPKILKSQDPKTGQFGTKPWIVTDQNAMWPLAVAWNTPDPGNPYYHSPQLLDAITSAGDALIAAQNKRGMWIFRKKDNSTWGDIYMPWTYSRWVRSYSLVRDGMSSAARARWEKGLTLGYSGIERTALHEMANIPAHHAMGLYIAGQTLGHPEWCTTAAAFMKRVCDDQSPDGYWSEHSGPVVGYNFVYMDAVGSYYGASHDPAVLPALRRGAVFHTHFTYPDGSAIETIDERQVYHRSPYFPNAGFSFTPEGRALMRRQWELTKHKVGSDNIASCIWFGEEGPPADVTADAGQSGVWFMGHDAAIHREGPWFICVSAFTAPISTSRWIQDRQNFVSVFHKDTGLILGGGNAKITTDWSNFVFGDASTFQHKPGDENPQFVPPRQVVHVPRAAEISSDGLSLALDYDAHHCKVKLEPQGASIMRILMSVDRLEPGVPAETHLTFLPQFGKAWKTSTSESGKLAEAESFELKGSPGAWFEHAGWRVDVPSGTRLKWPVYGHDQYKKDGGPDKDYARIVMTLPFSTGELTRSIELQVK